MENLIIEVISKWGPLVLIALVFFKQYDEDKQYLRNKDITIENNNKTLENNNKALEGLSGAVQSLVSTLEKTAVQQDVICKDIEGLKENIDDLKKIGEKNYTVSVLNGKQGEAIIRESFNKRIVEDIKLEMSEERKTIENDVLENGVSFNEADEI